MAKKRASSPPAGESISDTPVIQKSIQPLVFISHDTRDAGLAEEFSTLLKSASAGALKSFRSSDKKGTQGIEYGLEWYPAIMEKIDEASEVVCLLTKRSVERPWILYEAGVAKGKLGKNVIGMALGIPSKVAFTGPFAQFQNNDGSPEAIKKLVLDLVCKVPGLDPDHTVVGQLVDAFHKKANEILLTTEKLPIESKEQSNEDIVAKLFEEVKIMFESLPSRIENYVEPEFRRRKRRNYAMQFEELAHSMMGIEDPYLAFLMIVSFLKDDFPWIFELGMETYRDMKKARTLSEREKIAANFRSSFAMFDHPMVFGLLTYPKDAYFIIRESNHVFNRMLDRMLHEKGK